MINERKCWLYSKPKLANIFEHGHHNMSRTNIYNTFYPVTFRKIKISITHTLEFRLDGDKNGNITLAVELKTLVSYFIRCTPGY